MKENAYVSISAFEDAGSRQLKNTNSNSAKDAFGGHQGAVASSVSGNWPATLLLACQLLTLLHEYFVPLIGETVYFMLFVLKLLI